MHTAIAKAVFVAGKHAQLCQFWADGRLILLDFKAVYSTNFAIALVQTCLFVQC